MFGIAPALLNEVELWVKFGKENNLVTLYLTDFFQVRFLINEIRLVEKDLMAAAVGPSFRALLEAAPALSPS